MVIVAAGLDHRTRRVRKSAQAVAVQAEGQQRPNQTHHVAAGALLKL